MRRALFSIAYLPPLDYCAALVQCKEIVLEAQENFSKQSYRNRCYIESPNDALMLNLPVDHRSGKFIQEIGLSYREDWPQKHWHALRTAYGSAPFFDEVAPDIKEVFEARPATLWLLNQALLEVIFYWLQIKPEISYSKEWQAETDGMIDLREAFHPKKPSPFPKATSYPQMFDHKFGFRANLSIVDLVFNEGPAAYDYLMALPTSARW